jgi:hypothetical protein
MVRMNSSDSFLFDAAVDRPAFGAILTAELRSIREKMASLPHRGILAS